MGSEKITIGILNHDNNVYEQYISHVINLKLKKKVLSLLSKRKQRYIDRYSISL